LWRPRRRAGTRSAPAALPGPTRPPPHSRRVASAPPPAAADTAGHRHPRRSRPAPSPRGPTRAPPPPSPAGLPGTCTPAPARRPSRPSDPPRGRHDASTRQHPLFPENHGGPRSPGVTAPKRGPTQRRTNGSNGKPEPADLAEENASRTTPVQSPIRRFAPANPASLPGSSHAPAPSWTWRLSRAQRTTARATCTRSAPRPRPGDLVRLLRAARRRLTTGSRRPGCRAEPCCDRPRPGHPGIDRRQRHHLLG
jgi:hypothetical protein